MKKLLNTLFITSPDVYLSLDGENIVVKKENDAIGRYPLHNLEAVCTFGYAGASPALMGACAKRDISITFMTRNGNFLARVIGESKGNVILRKEQYRISDDEKRSAVVSRNFILGKIYNGKWILERATRDYPLRVDVPKIKRITSTLTETMKAVRAVEDLETLRGLEGNAAVQYNSVFDDLILQQKDHFFFTYRNKRPPLDNVNALLSFAYTMLSRINPRILDIVTLNLSFS